MSLPRNLPSAVLLFCSVVSTPLSADDPQSPAKTSPWRTEDLIFQEAINDFVLAPDARSVAWTKGEGDKEKDARISNLFLSSLTEDRTLQLTRGPDNVSSPQFSPDGEWIAFISSRARPAAKSDQADSASRQIWLISTHGGEAYPLTELARDPRRVDWLDKDTLIFSAEENPSAYQLAERKRKDDSQVVDDADHQAPVRLFKISVKDKKITRLTHNTDWIDHWAVSKDGKLAVATHARSLHYTFDQKVPPVTILYNLADGSEKQILTEGRLYPNFVEWAPDNSGFYAIVPFAHHPKFLTGSIPIVYFYDVVSAKPVEVPLDWENGVGFDLHATHDGFLTFLAAGARYDLAHYTRDKSGDSYTWHRHTLEGEHSRNIQNFAVNADAKTLVYQSSSASRMPQLFKAQLDGAQLSTGTQLTKLNEKLSHSRDFTKSEVIRWKGSNGEEVEGLLRYPANYEPGKKYPVITAIHGGPKGADTDSWHDSWAYPYQLLTARGAFILSPNYHGSSNYGLKWAESICCGNYYDLETPDINFGVDYLIEKGLVDPDKVATLGWSNGSILSTSLLVTYPNRYKVASVGAGDVEWISDWGNVIFGDSFDSYYFGKSPMEDPELYIRKSPFFKMDKVQASVLIFHGTADNQVPPAQSWSYFRVLQYYGKVPVKFVIFPGEPHGPRKLSHQQRKVDEELAWFDKYFFHSTPPADQSVKSGSPLEAALRGRNIAQSNGYYGVSAKQKRGTLLTPELVKRGDLEIARFEVTRFQFLEFLSSGSLKSKSMSWGAQMAEEDAIPSRQNLPQTKVGIEAAEAYSSWLSQQTGQIWRVPFEDEVQSLYENREGQNTLDYWAGYSPNPEDADRLRQEAKKLSAHSTLLKPVGSFRPEGTADEEPIYDLGGNAAEWVLARDGKGKIIGGSADCPAEPRSACTPAPEYVGFRVVRGAAKAPPQKDSKP